MVETSGARWLTSRRLFRLGLLHSNLLQHVPDMVDDGPAFAVVLRGHAERQDVTRMEGVFAKLIYTTLDY